MSHYAYIRVRHDDSDALANLEQYTQEIVTFCPEVKDNIIIERQPLLDVKLPPRQLVEHIDHILTPEDTLIIRSLYDIGNNTQQATQILSRCHELGMAVIILNQSITNIFEQKFFLLDVLNLLNDLEESYEGLKLSRRHYISLSQNKSLGRPAGSKYKDYIYELRCKGYKQREIANKLKISLSTIKRHWNKDIFE